MKQNKDFMYCKGKRVFVMDTTQEVTPLVMEGMVVGGMKVVRVYGSECEAPSSWCKSCTLCCDTQNELHWECVHSDGLTTSERKRKGYRISERERRLNRRKINLIMYVGAALIIIPWVVYIILLLFLGKDNAKELMDNEISALFMLIGGVIFMLALFRRQLEILFE